jgi:O-antigen ligase
LGIGALVYFAVALHVEGRAQLALLVDCLIGLVLLVTGYGLIFHGFAVTHGLGIWGVFPSRHHLSGILTVLLPLLTVLAFEAERMRRRLLAITAAIWCAIGLVACMERSAAIAVGVGLAVALGLTLALTPVRRRRRGAAASWRPRLVAVATCLVVFGGFFYSTDVNAIVLRRSRDISAAMHGRDASFAWRVQKWQGAAAMAARRPVLGWGPGQFVLQQSRFTHLGLSAEDVRSFGASFDEMAYNEYLQTAAELGFPGLLLYLLILVSFFSKAGRALSRLPNGLRRATLLGCMAGVAAQMVDAMANGSWRFTEVSIFFWLVLGLGVAVIRMAYQPDDRRHATGDRRQTEGPTTLSSVV